MPEGDYQKEAETLLTELDELANEAKQLRQKVQEASDTNAERDRRRLADRRVSRVDRRQK